MNEDRYGDELKYPPHPDPGFLIGALNAVLFAFALVGIVILIVNFLVS